MNCINVVLDATQGPYVVTIRHSRPEYTPVTTIVEVFAADERLVTRLDFDQRALVVRDLRVNPPTERSGS